MFRVAESSYPARQFPLPKAPGEVFGRKDVNAVFCPPSPWFKADENTVLGLRMLFCQGPQPFEMPRSDPGASLDLDCNLHVAENEADLDTTGKPPVCEFLVNPRQ